MKRLLATAILLGALALLPVASAAAAQHTQIKGIENHAGNSGTHADKPNTGVPVRTPATIADKATFNGGRHEVQTVTDRNHAVIPVEAKHGSTGARKTSRSTCACGCGGTPRPFCAYKDCSCSK